MNRRDTLKFLAGATAFAGTAGVLGRSAALLRRKPFTLPPLGYANDALEPHIDARTMQIHHDNHHAAYVNNLNSIVDKWPEMATKPIDEILSNLSAVPEAVRTLVRNNLGGHWNHTFFWELMTPGGAKAPAGDLKSAIDGAFGDFDKMKAAVKAGGPRPLRLRLGLAGGQGQEAHRLQHAEPGHPAHGRAPRPSSASTCGSTPTTSSTSTSAAPTSTRGGTR